MSEVYLATRWEDRHETNVIHRGAVLEGEKGRNGAPGFPWGAHGPFLRAANVSLESRFSPILASWRLYATTIGVGTRFAAFFYVFSAIELF